MNEALRKRLENLHHQLMECIKAGETFLLVEEETEDLAEFMAAFLYD